MVPASKPQPGHPAADGRQAVLVIDDEPRNLKVAVLHLQEFALQILTAPDGRRGLERARLTRPDLILLDVMMPEIDGFETCRRLKADPATRDIPVIFMTALSEPQDKVRAFDVGGVDYVTKPIEARELVARVRAHLEIRAAQAALVAQNQSLEQDVAERTDALRRELARSEASERARERLLERVERHSEHLRELSRQLIADRADGSHALASEVSRRLAVARTHLEHARDALDARQPDDPCVSHIAQALGLLEPVLEQARSVQAVLERPEGRPLDNPLLRLSARELEVARMMVEGAANKEIAYELGLARTTVATYRGRILTKLEIETLPGLVRLWGRYPSP